MPLFVAPFSITIWGKSTLLSTVGSRVLLDFHSLACLILYHCDMLCSNLQHPSFKHFPDSVGSSFYSVDEDVDGFLADALDRLLDV